MTQQQQPPESASPVLADGLAVTVSQIYAAGEAAILAAITLNVRAALSTANPGSALRGRSAPVQATVRRTMDHAEDQARRAVPGVLARAYGRGHGTERRVAEQAVQAVLDQLGALRNGVMRWVSQLWNRLTAATYAPNPLALADQALQQAAGRGITAFRDSRGRDWGLVPYVERTVQHAAGGAAIDGFADRLNEGGGDLVIVTESPHPCPLCNPWEHHVLSVSGASLQYPSMATAREAGLFHPNCHHTIVTWKPGFVWPPHSLHNRPGTYTAVQRQRDIERHVREWKRREAAALDDVTRLKARAKVRAWQAELRRHLAAEGLTRSRQRERTDYGHTPPITHAHG